MTFNPPTITFAPLSPTSQGSVSYTHTGFHLLSSATGPTEPPRRDDTLPEQASLEITVRPPTGPGGPRERHLERTVHSTLAPLLDLRAHPRCMVQVVLQLLRTPEDKESAEPGSQHAGSVGVLPHLVNAGVLALLDANMRMTGIALGVVVGSWESKQSASYDGSSSDGDSGDSDVDMGEEGELRIAVLSEEKAADEATRTGAGVHAFVFTGKGEMLLAESEGCFGFEAWEGAAKAAQRAICGGKGSGEGLVRWLRGEVGEELKRRRRWRDMGSEDEED